MTTTNTAITPPAAPFSIDDTARAWVPHGRFTVDGAPCGPLAGLRFAAKDVFDIAGHTTGAGNPTWLATHAPAAQHSPLVQQLLAAGAALHGKVISDELAYSIHGHNLHYGMPLNAAAPERIPGGSSSGSVAAVAARLVDFALGTDTGGSTRVPASYCGVWGLRTTHGLLSRTGMVPLHASFDTATWFAHDGSTFARVAGVLLPAQAFTPRRARLVQDALAQADAAFTPLLVRVAAALQAQLGTVVEPVSAADEGQTLEQWRQHYVTWGAHEAWQAHGAWISAHEPAFEDAIAGRWHAASQIDAESARAARAAGLAVRERVRGLVGDDAVLLLPSAATVAPLRDASGPEIDATRMRTLRICCIAGLAGLPQVSLPLRTPEGLPAGISLIGPAGSDQALVQLAVRVWERLQATQD
ncbi:MAG: amidase [Comamonadaceae bacterium]|nr:MAG: amidase [Comamonadaceae bacterium]